MRLLIGAFRLHKCGARLAPAGVPLTGEGVAAATTAAVDGGGHAAKIGERSKVSMYLPLLSGTEP